MTKKLKHLDKALKSIYFAGNTSNAKLLFLASLTRFSNKPVSVLIKGASGSGKSELMNTILRFIPEADKEVFTGISEKSISFMRENSLRHKVLGIQEFSVLNNPSGNTILRSLLSEGKIRRQTSITDAKDNNFTTQISEVRGPVSLFMTTTEKSIHPEDENRMISITVDQSAEQKRKVLLAKADAFNGIIASQEIIKDMQSISIAYRKTLKKVEIPYVKNIAESMDTNFDQVLRHFDKMLSLIEAHALLHQKDRDIKDGKVIANEEDYSVVCSLLEPILSIQSKKVIDSDIIKIIKAIKEHGEIKVDFLDSTPDDFDKLDTSNSFLAEKLKMSPSVVSMKCNKAKELGLIINEAPNGKPAIYSIIKDPNSLDRVLPSWTELK
jgi:energy-coupling factor transporter ATP-binding protein EcfA2